MSMGHCPIIIYTMLFRIIDCDLALTYQDLDSLHLTVYTINANASDVISRIMQTRLPKTQ